eukprot:6528734-Prymnesium_polylepis.1
MQEDGGVAGQVAEARFDFMPFPPLSARFIQRGDGLERRAGEERGARRPLVDDAPCNAAVFSRHGASRCATLRREGDELVLLPPSELGELSHCGGRCIDARSPVVQREE